MCGIALRKNLLKKVKERIASAPILGSPDYSKGFIIYSFASKNIIIGILMQEDDEGNE